MAATIESMTQGFDAHTIVNGYEQSPVNAKTLPVIGDPLRIRTDSGRIINMNFKPEVPGQLPEDLPDDPEKGRAILADQFGDQRTGFNESVEQNELRIDEDYVNPQHYYVNPDGSITLEAPAPDLTPVFRQPTLNEQSPSLNLDKYRAGQIKIGNTWLPLPPEAISVGTDNEIITHRLLRSPGSLAERSGHASTMIQIQARVDWGQFADFICPVLAQFAVSPFLPVQNIDLDLLLKDKGLLPQGRTAKIEAAAERLQLIQDKIDALEHDIRQKTGAGIVPASAVRELDAADLARGIGDEFVAIAKERNQPLEEYLQEASSNWEKKLGETRAFWPDNSRLHEIVDRVRWNGTGLQWEQYQIDQASQLPTTYKFETEPSAEYTPNTGAVRRYMFQAAAQFARLKDAYERALQGYAPIPFYRKMTETWMALETFSCTTDRTSHDTVSIFFALRLFNYLPYTSRMFFRASNGKEDVPVYFPEQATDFNRAWKHMLKDASFSGVGGVANFEQNLPYVFIKPKPVGDDSTTQDTVIAVAERVVRDDGSAVTSLDDRLRAVIPNTFMVEYVYGGDYVEMPIEGEYYPTLQWTGRGTGEAVIAFKTGNQQLVDTIKDIDKFLARTANDTQALGQFFYCYVSDTLLQACGFTSAEIRSIDIDSAGPADNFGEGPVWDIKIALHQIVPKLHDWHRTRRQNEQTDRIGAIKWIEEHDKPKKVREQLRAVFVYDQPVSSLAPDQFLPTLRTQGKHVWDETAELADDPDLELTVDSPIWEITRELTQRWKKLNKILSDNTDLFTSGEQLAQERDSIEARIKNLRDNPSRGSGNRGRKQQLEYRLREIDRKAREQGKQVTTLQDRLIAKKRSLEGVIGEVGEILDTLIVRSLYTLPKELREKLLGSQESYLFADWEDYNLYPDFYNLQIRDGEISAPYMNPTSQRLERRSSGWYDPWHFLYKPEPGKKIGDEADEFANALSSEIGDQFVAGNTPEDLKAIKDVYISPQIDAADGDDETASQTGDQRRVVYSNQVNINKLKAASLELKQEPIYEYMDYSNFGSVLPNERRYNRQVYLKAVQDSDLYHRNIAGAYPTFWMAFIERDSQTFGVFDDFYNYQALQSVAIVRHKNSPMDTAYITVSNLFGNLGGHVQGIVGADAAEGMRRANSARIEEENIDAAGILQDPPYVEEQPALDKGAFPLQVGTSVIIKMGYGNSIRALETVFTGQIAKIQEGPTMELVLQGYGAELTQTIGLNQSEAVIKAASQREIAEKMLSMEPVRHFGRDQRAWWHKLLFGDPLEDLSDDEGLDRKRLETVKMAKNWNPFIDPDKKVEDVNIWLPDTLSWVKTEDTRVSGLAVASPTITSYDYVTDSDQTFDEVAALPEPQFQRERRQIVKGPVKVCTVQTPPRGEGAVIDGDTIWVIRDDRPDLGHFKIRLLGCDSAELRTKEPYAVQARDWLADRLPEGKKILVDSLAGFNAGSLDPFDRMLAYIWDGDTMLNLLAVETGNCDISAQAHKYETIFFAAKADAVKAKLGMWANQEEGLYKVGGIGVKVPDRAADGLVKGATPRDNRTIQRPGIESTGPTPTGVQYRDYVAFITGNQTPWQVLKEIALDNPGVCVAVRPFDARSTVFMGQPDMPYFHTSQSLVAHNLRELLVQEKIDRGDIPDNLEDVPRKPFRQYHLCRSGYNLIRNNLMVTENFYTKIVLGYDRYSNRIWSGDKNDLLATGGPMATSASGINSALSTSNLAVFKGWHVRDHLELSLDPNLPEDQQRSLFTEQRNVTTPDRALRYMVSMLQETVSRAYHGSILLRSDRDIWPHDVIVLHDEVNQMYGMIEVDEAILRFDREMGYHYEIKPNALVRAHSYNSISDHAIWYKLHTQGGIQRMRGWTHGFPFPLGVGETFQVEGYLTPARREEILWQTRIKNAGAPRELSGLIPRILGAVTQLIADRDDGIVTIGNRRQATFFERYQYAMQNNHPLSVFPLMYQGRTWWPLEHQGSTLELFDALSARSERVDKNKTLGSSLREVGFRDKFKHAMRVINSNYRAIEQDLRQQ